MEILILIGIFAFVVAIIFRSNEALNRVQEVEKEVKVIEEEMAHTVQGVPAQEASIDNELGQTDVAPDTPSEQVPGPTVPVETHMEEPLPETPMSTPVQTQAQTPISDTPFPSAENIHTS